MVFRNRGSKPLGTPGFFFPMSRRIQTRFHFATRRTAAPIWRNSGFPFRGTAENFPKSGKPGVPMSRRDGNRNPSTGYLGGPCRSVTETAAQVWGTSSFHVTARRKPPPGSRGARGFPFFAARRIPPNSGKLGDFHVPPRQKPWPRCGELGFPCRGTTENRPSLRNFGASVSWHEGNRLVLGTLRFPSPAPTKTAPLVRGTWVSMSRHDRNRPSLRNSWFPSRGTAKNRPSLANLGLPFRGATETAPLVRLRNLGFPRLVAAEAVQMRGRLGFARPQDFMRRVRGNGRARRAFGRRATLRASRRTVTARARVCGGERHGRVAHSRRWHWKKRRYRRNVTA